MADDTPSPRATPEELVEALIRRDQIIWDLQRELEVLSEARVEIDRRDAMIRVKDADKLQAVAWLESVIADRDATIAQLEHELTLRSSSGRRVLSALKRAVRRRSR